MLEALLGSELFSISPEQVAAPQKRALAIEVDVLLARQGPTGVMLPKGSRI